MSPLYLHDRDDPDATRHFDEWRVAHALGFYANRQRVTRWMLHQATCRHEYEPGQARTAATPKLCDDSPVAIRAWMAARGLELVSCATCKPDDGLVTAPIVALPATLKGAAEHVLADLPEHDPALLTSLDDDVVSAYAAQMAAGVDRRALEGELRVRLVRDRYREGRLRDAKVAQARARDPDGRLRCEVPGCRFDFGAAYGELGESYIEVHHLRPLAMRDEAEETGLDDLALVCANCHAMIHRGGGCRPMADLMPATPNSGLRG